MLLSHQNLFLSHTQDASEAAEDLTTVVTGSLQASGAGGTGITEGLVLRETLETSPRTDLVGVHTETVTPTATATECKATKEGIGEVHRTAPTRTTMPDSNTLHPYPMAGSHSKHTQHTQSPLPPQQLLP